MKLLRLSLLFAILGLLLSAPLLLRYSAGTFVLFAFAGQPLLLLAFLGFLVAVVGELRSKGPLRDDAS